MKLFRSGMVQTNIVVAGPVHCERCTRRTKVEVWFFPSEGRDARSPLIDTICFSQVCSPQASSAWNASVMHREPYLLCLHDAECRHCRLQTVCILSQGPRIIVQECYVCHWYFVSKWIDQDFDTIIPP